MSRRIEEGINKRRNKIQPKESKKPSEAVLYAVWEVFLEPARFQELVRNAVIGCAGRSSATNESPVSRDLADTKRGVCSR